MINVAFNEPLSCRFLGGGWVPIIMEKVNELCLTHKTRLTESHCCELYSIRESRHPPRTGSV